MTSSLTPRVSRLKEELQGTPRSICLERARWITRFYRENAVPSDPSVVTRAKAVSFVLDHLPVIIHPGELIVGAITSRRNAAMLYPEYSSLAILPEARTLGRRRNNPFHIDEDDIRALERDIFPFWADRTVGVHALRRVLPQTLKTRVLGRLAGSLLKAAMRLPVRVKEAAYARMRDNPESVVRGMKKYEPFRLFSLGGVFVLTEFAGISHITPDYRAVIERGVSGIIADVSVRLRETIDAEHRDFYTAVLIVLSGLVRFAGRYAQEADRLAAVEKDEKRAIELRTIAENCRAVPLNPPRTFHQALQGICLVHMALFLENYDNAISFGRMDQYLHPLYREGIDSGGITPRDAEEMLQCLWIKLSEFVPFFPGKYNDYFSGLLTSQGLCVGGLDADGRDATNDLSLLILSSVRSVNTAIPNLYARFHPGTPDSLWKGVWESIASGSPHPSVYNDETIVRALTNAGCTLEDARDYAPLGCVETNPQGKTMGSTDAALVNLALCLELALNDGRSIMMNAQVGPRTGEAGAFISMEDIIAAFRTQTAFVVGKMVDGTNLLSETHRDEFPSPLLSSFVRGPLETGVDVTGGGARYNFSGVQGVGVADVADSLAAVDWVVFREKKMDLHGFLEAVRGDFAGREDLRRLILTRAPRYGRDNDLANGYARLAAGIYCDEVMRHRNTRGGRYIPGFYSVTSHIAFGKLTSTLPSGRLRGEPLANGISPSALSSDRGPTAVLNSVTSADFARAANGVTLQMGLDPSVLRDHKGEEVFRSLMEGYFSRGGMQAQFTALSPDLLRRARDHPSDYRWLTVRVAGYSAYFTDLSPEAQDEIISRAGGTTTPPKTV